MHRMWNIKFYQYIENNVNLFKYRLKHNVECPTGHTYNNRTTKSVLSSYLTTFGSGCVSFGHLTLASIFRLINALFNTLSPLIKSSVRTASLDRSVRWFKLKKNVNEI